MVVKREERRNNTNGNKSMLVAKCSVSEWTEYQAQNGYIPNDWLELKVMKWNILTANAFYDDFVHLLWYTIRQLCSVRFSFRFILNFLTLHSICSSHLATWVFLFAQYLLKWMVIWIRIDCERYGMDCRLPPGAF